jgi:hypothetical protein
MPLDTFKKAMMGPIADVLRSAGFRKSGLKFSRPVNDIIHLVTVQSSVGSAAGWLKATVNLGIWIPALTGEDSTPNVWEAQWQERLGFLMPKPYDRWWEAGSDAEAVAAGREIAEALTSFGLPTFDALATSESIAELWRAGRSPGLTEIWAQRLLKMLEATSRP